MSISFADLTPATVTLDGELNDVPAYLPAHRWNGWECPYFRADDIRAMRDAFDAYGADVNAYPDGDTRYSWDDATDLPSFVTTWEDGDTYDAVSVLTVDGVPMVTIGWSSWVWSRQD